MAIMRWDPFGEMLSMQADMDRLLRRMGTTSGTGVPQTGWMPRIDVVRRGEDLVVRADLAGVKPENVDVSVTDNVLTISGNREVERTETDEKWLVRERTFGTFERSMVLPEGIDPASIVARTEHGVLTVEIPGAVEAAKPKTTKIAIGGTTEVVAEQAPADTTVEATITPPAETPAEERELEAVGARTTPTQW